MIQLRTNVSKLEQDADIIAWACKTYHRKFRYIHSDYDVRTNASDNTITVKCAGSYPEPSEDAISYLKKHFTVKYDEITDSCQGVIKYYEFKARYSDNS